MPDSKQKSRGGAEVVVYSCSWLTRELTVVVGASGILLVWAERRAGGGAGAEAGVAQG